MTRDEFVASLMKDGKIVVKRCTQSYLIKNNTYQWLIDNTPANFGTVGERIKHVLYGGGYCETCGTRTNVHISGRGFARFCKIHAHDAKKGKRAHNTKDINKDVLEEMYVRQQKSLSTISKVLGNVSNVTVRKKLDEYGICQRSHSENQSLHSGSKGVISFDYPSSWWIEQYRTKSSEQIALELGCSPSLVLLRLRAAGITPVTFGKDSIPEQKIIGILDQHGVTYRKKVRGLLFGNRELDIVIDSHNLAIEVNGIFWHSEFSGKRSDYHISKTVECQQRGIQLIHLWDEEINKYPEIVGSMIMSKLGLCKTIYARKCTVSEVSSADARMFFSSNHLQGFSAASKTIGLFYDGQLVCAGSFMKPRYDKDHQWELIRFASLAGYTVVGGLSRILKNISGSVVSYANRRWSKGLAYQACGFKLIRTTSPGYYYTKDFRTLESRVKFQKHKLKHSKSYASHLSESQIMELDGYSRVWDCGQLVYSLVRDK